jgi:WD40 repeat protein
MRWRAVADVFVSYAREDRGFVRRLADALKARGRESWVDWEGIEPSDQWRESVREAIDAADAFLFVLSRPSLASRSCSDELEHATGEHKRLIVVAREDVDGLEPPAAIEAVNWIFLRERDDFEHGIDGLERSLNLDLDLVRIHTRVLTRAKAWDLGGRRPTPLLRGEELRAAQRWIARAAAGSNPQPTELQAEFVEESRHRAARRQRLTVGGSVAVALISAALAAFALVQRAQAQHQARVARSRQLAVEAEAELSSNPEDAIKVAADAVRVQATPQAVHALTHALDASRLLLDLRQGAAIEAVAFAPSGKTVAVGSRDGTVRLWRLADRRLLWSQRHDSASALQLAFTTRGDVLAVSREVQRPDGSSACSVETDSAATGAPMRTLVSGSSSSTVCTEFIAFRGSTRILTVARSGEVTFFNVDSGRQSRPALASALSDRETTGLTMAFSQRGDMLAIAGFDRNEGVVRVIALPSGRLITTVPLGEAVKVNTLAFSPDEADLVISDTNLGAWIEDIRRRVEVASLPGQYSAGDVVAWGPNDRLIVGGSQEGQAYVWASTSRRTVEVLHDPSGGSFNALSFAGNGLLATGSDDGSVRIWAPDPDHPSAAFPVPGGAPGYAAYAPGAHLVAVGDAAGTVLVLDDKGRRIASRHLHGDGPFAITNGGDLIFARHGSIARERARTGGPERNFSVRLPSPSDHLASSTDGRIVAVASLSQNAATSYITVFDARTRTVRQMKIRSRDGDSDVAVSPDGRYVAVVAPPEVRVLRTSDLKAVATQEGQTVGFSPSGRFLAIQHGDLSISILRTADWRQEISIGSEPFQASLAFSVGDRLLLASSGDGVLRVWDARDGTLLATRYVTDTPVYDSSSGLSPPILTQSGLAVVGAYSTYTTDVFNLCSDCLDSAELLEDADGRLRAIRPVTTR